VVEQCFCKAKVGGPNPLPGSYMRQVDYLQNPSDFERRNCVALCNKCKRVAQSETNFDAPG
jgi:hypothetical protein